MVQDPVLVEISSDEEDEVIRESGKKSVNCDSSMDWLDNMLGLDNDPWTSGDIMVVDELSCPSQEEKLTVIPWTSSDIEVINELSCPSQEEKLAIIPWTSGDIEVVNELSCPSQKEKLAIIPLTTEICASNDDSDDDCIILDGDPDKAAVVTPEKANCSDELLILGEKGQVACRDFPHSRHICANFPFNITSHDKFCKMCHCYVCDVPAPCTDWALHCHSSDKEDKWISERKSFRRLNHTPPTTPTLTPTPTSMAISKSRSARRHLHPAFKALISMRTNPPAAAQPPFRRCSVATPLLPPPPPYIPKCYSQSQPNLSSSCPKVPTRISRAVGDTHPVCHQRLPLPPPPLPYIRDSYSQSQPNLSSSFPKVPTKRSRMVGDIHPVCHQRQPMPLPPLLPDLGRNSLPCPQPYKPRSFSSSQPNSYG